MAEATLPSPSLCKACAGITLEALSSRYGYSHLDDIWSLDESARSCAVCNLLQLSIRGNAAAMSGEVDTDLPGLETALHSLNSMMYRDEYSLKRPCPVVLVRSYSQSFGAYDIHVRAGFKWVPGYVFWSRDYTIGKPLGVLRLHKDNGEMAVPLVSRVEEAAMFDKFRQWLYGKITYEIHASDVSENLT